MIFIAFGVFSLFRENWTHQTRFQRFKHAGIVLYDSLIAQPEPGEPLNSSVKLVKAAETLTSREENNLKKESKNVHIKP